jgi:hypothetical protein
MSPGTPITLPTPSARILCLASANSLTIERKSLTFAREGDQGESFPPPFSEYNWLTISAMCDLYFPAAIFVNSMCFDGNDV